MNKEEQEQQLLTALEELYSSHTEERDEQSKTAIEQRIKDAMGYEYDSTLFHGYTSE